MKNIKIKYILLTWVLLGSLNACNFTQSDDIDPNQTYDVPLEEVARAAQLALIYNTQGFDLIASAVFADQIANLSRGSSYYLSNHYDWTTYYPKCIKQTNVAIDQATKADNQKIVGIMKVVQAYTFGNLTALYGKIPFTDALKLNNTEPPHFNTQTEVYAGLQIMLDEAIQDLSGNGTIVGDLFFNGDASKWRAVAYTLKARYYLHTGDIVQAYTNAANGISSPSDNMVFHFTGVGSDGVNLMYSFGRVQRTGDIGVGLSLVFSMLDSRNVFNSSNSLYRGNNKTDETERLNFFFSIPDFRGVIELGHEDGQIFGKASPATLLSYTENELIKAEAYARVLNSNAALAALNNARNANAQKFPKGLYDAYVLTDFDNTGIVGSRHQKGTQTSNLIQEIIEEKYISLFGQIEVFNDTRRTKSVVGAQNHNYTLLIPQRLLYPEEVIKNNPNVPNPIPGLYDYTEMNQ